MLFIELRINYKTIRTIGVHNVSSIPVHQSCTAECPYEVWDLTNLTHPSEKKFIGRLRHERKDGAEALAQKVLQMVVKYDNKKKGQDSEK